MKYAATAALLAWLAVGGGAIALPEPTSVDELSRDFLDDDAAAWTELGGGSVSDEAARLALSRYMKFGEQCGRACDPPADDDWLRALETDRRWQTAHGDIRQLHSLYERWRRMVSAESGIEAQRHQWLRFARSVTGNNDGSGSSNHGLKQPLPRVLAALHAHVTERNLFNNVLLRAIDEQQACRLSTSPHRLVYEVYVRTAGAQLAGHAVLQWSHAVLAVHAPDAAQDAALAAAEARVAYEKARGDARRYALKALASAERTAWTCDPPAGHVDNTTYAELTQLLQGYLENEKDMNPRSNCMQDCSYYEYTTSQGCYHGYCKRQRRCRGKLLKCRYVASDMTVCEAPAGTTRRYEYIDYDNSRTFGRNTGCVNARTVRVESWWRWLFWHCSYCLCLCDDSTSARTDRHWSLRPALADTARDMVVTGVRLVKMERVIHLQVQQTKLAAGGRVERATVEWLPVRPFRVDVAERHGGGAREGRDFHVMSYEKRALDLDDVTVPLGHVVTGVRWRVVGVHLNLEVLAAPLKWREGRLDRPQNRSYWVSSDMTLARRELVLSDPDVPTRQTQPSRSDSQSDMYIEFTNSDLEKDVGQTTVPFIDTQRVGSEPPAPLAGVGLYHKGQVGYGGYVAPRIITYDYGPHMRD